MWRLEGNDLIVRHRGKDYRADAIPWKWRLDELAVKVFRGIPS